MGVRGLTTLVASAGSGRRVRLQKDSDREFTICAIDASAMVQWLMRRGSRLTGMGSASAPFRAACRSFLISLLKLNFEIVLFTDGAQEEQKDSARRSRYVDRSKTSQRFFTSLKNNQFPKNFVAPWFRDRNMMDVARSLQAEYGENRIRVIPCAAEADDSMAAWVAQTPNALAISQDSDFFLFPNISYMDIATITVNKNYLQGQVVDSAQLAAHYSLTPKKWIIAAMHLGNDSCPRIHGMDLDAAAQVLRDLPDEDEALIQYLRDTWSSCPETAVHRWESYCNPQVELERSFLDVICHHLKPSNEQKQQVAAIIRQLEPLFVEGYSANMRFLYDDIQWVSLSGTDLVTNERQQAAYRDARVQMYHLFPHLVEKDTCITERTVDSTGRIKETDICLDAAKALSSSFLVEIVPADIGERLQSLPLCDNLYCEDICRLPDEIKSVIVAVCVLPAALRSRAFLEEWLALPQESRWILLAIRLLRYHNPVQQRELELLVAHHRAMLDGKGATAKTVEVLMKKQRNDRQGTLCRPQQLHAMLEAPLLLIDLLQLLFGVPESQWTYRLLDPFLLATLPDNAVSSEDPYLSFISWAEPASKPAPVPVPVKTPGAKSHDPPSAAPPSTATSSASSKKTSVDPVATPKSKEQSKPAPIPAAKQQPVEIAPRENPVASKPVAMSVLPVLAHRKKIIDAIRQNRIVAIQGDTGCGKSSQVPQFALQEAKKRFRNNKRKRRPFVIVTQPRRIAAISLAKRVASEMKTSVGGLVGYKIGQEMKADKKNTQLLYVTTGWLLEKLIHQPEYLSRCTHLILDEIHERSIDNDLLNLMVRQLLHQQENAATRLIVMSATFDIGLFATYFKSVLPPPQEVPQLFVGVKRYPVEIVYLDQLSRHSLLQTKSLKGKNGAIQKMCSATQLSDRMNTAKRLVPDMIEALAQQHKDDSEGNTVLVFLPGLQEIEDLDELLRASFSLPVVTTDDNDAPAKAPRHNIEVCLLHSLIDETEQMKVFASLAPGLTRVILASNIAESSVTLPQTRYIIDVGLVRQVEFNIRTGITALQTACVSHASANQRSGRCGRLFPGVTFRLYTEKYFDNNMAPYDIPEMLRLSLSSTVLRLKSLSDNFTSDSPLSDPRQSLLNALQPPENAAIDRAVTDLIDNDVFRIQSSSLAPYLTPAEVTMLPEMRGEQAIRLVDRLNGKHPEMKLDVLKVSQVTDLGKFLAHLPFDLRVGRLVAMGARCGRFVCHALLVATELSSAGSVFLTPYMRPNTSASEHQVCARIAYHAQKERHKHADLLSDAFPAIRLFREHCLSKRNPEAGLHQTRYFRFMNTVRGIARKLEEVLPHHRQWLKIFNRNQVTTPKELNKILSFEPKDVDMMRLLMAMAFKNDGLVKVTFNRKEVPPPSRNLETMESIEKRITMVETVPSEYRTDKAMRNLLPLLMDLPEVVNFPPHPSSQMCLVFPEGKTVNGLHVAGSALRVWSSFMKKGGKLTLQAPTDNKIVALETMRVPYKTGWRYQGKGCLVDRFSVLPHIFPEQGSSLSLCAIPGTVQWVNTSPRLEYITVIPPESALTALILLTVHKGTVPEVRNNKNNKNKKGKKGKKKKKQQQEQEQKQTNFIKQVKVQKEQFPLPFRVPADVLQIPEVCEFVELERNLLQTSVDSATISQLNERKLAVVLDKINHLCAANAPSEETSNKQLY